MAEELDNLREQLEQLLVENERLKQQTQNGASAGGVSSSTLEGNGQRREQALYLPRERKCPKFSGKVGSLPIEDWIEEVESCIRGRHMSEWDKAVFVYDHLEGEARTEIKFRSTEVRENSTQIFSVLRELYCSSFSYVTLQQQFFDRKQKEGESFQEFSHALMDLMDRIRKANPNAMSDHQVVLRDQFCENVYDHTLRRELKRLVRQNPLWTLLELRKEAMRWVEEGQPIRNRPSRVAPHSLETQAIVTCEENRMVSSEFAELKDMVVRQQAQLDLILKTLSNTEGSSSNVTRPPRSTRFRRTPDGQPICVKCNQGGHIARYCTNIVQTGVPDVPNSSVGTAFGVLPGAEN
ncbi:uncharacterized protein [Paramisgurnus dabryanus]|uniref:uncharacterized protein n=1 Tax=Paramisgurnus dabryanus TaxID=90735 RepID=UPI0031F3CD66